MQNPHGPSTNPVVRRPAAVVLLIVSGSGSILVACIVGSWAAALLRDTADGFAVIGTLIAIVYLALGFIALFCARAAANGAPNRRTLAGVSIVAGLFCGVPMLGLAIAFPGGIFVFGPLLALPAVVVVGAVLAYRQPVTASVSTTG